MTDVVDSTLSTARLDEASLTLLWRDHDRCARELLQRWGGREIDKSDGFLLVFDDAVAAAGYAAAYHRALRQLTPRLSARAGLHVGEVQLRVNPAEHVARGAKPLEVDGLAKAVVARTMSIALGGQTLATESARAQLGHATCRSHGHWRMKGLDQPIELFEIGDADAPWRPPTGSVKGYRVVRVGDQWLAAQDIRSNVPAQRDEFVGRDSELRALAQRFDCGARLVSVLGVGGGGKTRLAQHYSRCWLGDYPGGVWYCDLSQARDATEIVQGVARGLELDLHGEDPLARTSAAIAGRGDCLLILDNFEQVASHAEATLGIWLERAPNARFLVTSRERLRITGEHVLLLDPMPQHDAARLFSLRAAAACGTAADAFSDDKAVVPLVGLLDGIPLAIELAAARTPVMSLLTLLTRVGQSFSLLTSRAGRLDRQATLRATLDWSWDLLTPSERTALAQLSVFEGSASLTAVEAVVDVGVQAPQPLVVDVLQSLVEKSLVRPVGDARFTLLQTVHAYAREKLQVDCDLERAAQLRHARHFASIGPRGAVSDRCIDLDNLVAAVRRGVAIRASAEAVGALEGAWAGLRLRGPFDLALTLAWEVASLGSLDPGSRATVELVAGWVLKMRGKVSEARGRYGCALNLSRRAAKPAVLGRVLGLFGDLDVGEGLNDDGQAKFVEALAIARDANDQQLECQVLSSMGNLSERLGRLEDAARSYLGALDIARRLGDRRWEGGLLGNLGVVRDEQGRADEAREHYEAALLAAHESGDRQWEGNTLCNLGLLLQMRGHLAAAQSTLERSLRVAREIGHSALESVVLCNLALVAEDMQAPEAALQNYIAAQKVAREISDRRAEGQVLTHLGLLHARQGRIGAARKALAEGEALLISVSDAIALGLLLCACAEAEQLAGANREAEAAFQRARQIAREHCCEPDSEFGLRLATLEAAMAGPRPSVAGD